MSLGYYAIVFGGVLGIGAFATIGADPGDGDGYLATGCAMSFILATLTVAITFIVDLAGGLS